MVNGYLPPPARQELFAGLCHSDGAFCPPGGAVLLPKPLINIDLFHWHGFCSSPLAAAWESGPRTRRGCPGDGIVIALKGSVSDGECPSRRPVAADGAQS